MPTYDYECDTCGNKQTVIASITEYDEMTLKDQPCQTSVDDQDSDEQDCSGHYEHTFEDRNGMFSFKGGPPTPKFHRGGNQG